MPRKVSKEPIRALTVEPPQSEPLMLTGRQRRILREGIIGAYRYNDLLTLLFEGMNVNLDSIARGDKYETILPNLIEDFNADGRIKKFIKLIVKNKPNSPYLKEVKNEFKSILGRIVPEIPSNLSKDEFLSCVGNLVSLVRKDGITDIQKCIIEGLGKGLTYQHIAGECKCNINDIRKETSKNLFPIISEALTQAMGKPVKLTKTNFIQCIEDYYNYINKNSNLLGNNLDNNNTKINKLEGLKDILRQRNSAIITIIKSHLSGVHNNTSNVDFDETIEIIIKLPNKQLFPLLVKLSQDTRIDSSTRSYIEQTAQELRELLNIADADYNAWIEGITLVDIEPNAQGFNNYLIIKIDESKSHLQTTSQKYKFAAWFLQLNQSQDRKSDYVPLGVNIVPNSEDGYTEEEIKPILTQIIEDCHERGGPNLNIEFFTDGKLLYTDFESWEYNCLDSPTQLKRVYFVNVRSLIRLEKRYHNMPAYKNWIDRWLRMQNTPIDTTTLDNSEACLCQNTTIMSNLCASNQKDLEELFKITLKYGIPLVIGSRYHVREGVHRTEINNRLQGRRITELSSIVQAVRQGSPVRLEEQPGHLGHHLLCFLEDPNRMPPFQYLTSSHLAN